MARQVGSPRVFLTSASLSFGAVEMPHTSGITANPSARASPAARTAAPGREGAASRQWLLPEDAQVGQAEDDVQHEDDDADHVHLKGSPICLHTEAGASGPGRGS